MAFIHLSEPLKRGLVSLVRRKVFYLMMVVAPIASAFFLLDLMKEGVVEHAPVGIVDLDNSATSRNLSRNLSALSSVDIQYHFNNFADASDAVQRGTVLGFFLIPGDFEKKALSGQQPTLSYYINYAYFTPASSQYRGFKTITVLANGAVAMTVLNTLGLSSHQVETALQPVNTQVHGIGNPWTNYGFYLNASFIPCLLSLIILLVTSFSIGTELKYGTCREWLASAGGSMEVALAGKLLPQSIIFTAVGWFIQFMMYRLYGYPLNCNPLIMMFAMVLLVLANQGFAMLIMCIIPNFRLGATVCTLLGVVTFSFCGFSLPVEAMYPWVHSLGYIMPMRYFFLIQIDQALNGFDIYYSRIFFVALIAFILLPWLFIKRLKRECENPIYVP